MRNPPATTRTHHHREQAKASWGDDPSAIPRDYERLDAAHFGAGVRDPPTQAGRYNPRLRGRSRRVVPPPDSAPSLRHPDFTVGHLHVVTNLGLQRPHLHESV